LCAFFPPLPPAFFAKDCFRFVDGVLMHFSDDNSIRPNIGFNSGKSPPKRISKEIRN
jgi:hypothetical protein